jgi:glutathione peroxidase-family protein
VQYVRPGKGYVIPSALTLLQKGDVNGLFATPLFKSLKTQCGGADVGWNFEAVLVDKTGMPVKRYTTGAGGGPNSFMADIAKLL